MTQRDIFNKNKEKQETIDELRNDKKVYINENECSFKNLDK